MKLSAALPALFLPAAISAQGVQPDARIKDCYFVKYFGSGTDLSASGVVDFNVVTGADVVCHTACKRGEETSVGYNFGGATTGSGDTATDVDPDCTMKTEFTATADSTSLGWSISLPLEYKKVVMACYCTDDGTDLTIDNIEATIDDIEETFDNYLNEVQDYIENNAGSLGDGCFSEDMTVQVLHKGEVAMKDLELGDKVLTGKDTYEPIYTFGHRKTDFQKEMYQIYTDGTSKPLEMTGNHMVMALDAKGHTHSTRADHLEVGDELFHVEYQKKVTVTAVQTEKKKGLYMPLTPSGEIVVNGILASNYISISDTAPGVVEHSQMFFPMNEQTLSHWWMSPVRMLCMGVTSGFCSNGFEGTSAYETQEGDEGILPWLLMGRHFAHVAENQPTLVRFMLGVPTFLLFGLFNVVEHAFLGPAYAPFLFMAAVALVVALKKKLANGESSFETSAGYNLLNSVV
ncbi:Protein hedgehog [Seminavis robusta]|uniref:Protein hedgehog n=1 Tax=Seminavis robusta TaxID=568900 RepID=A0A9N8EIT8_9STRA|nr:Protein hedgehog [Seminavis robusta]|eukprot:Sro1004_g230120.1 Protein hedgehog (460) ;mRNA; r:12199-13692